MIKLPKFILDVSVGVSTNKKSGACMPATSGKFLIEEYYPFTKDDKLGLSQYKGGKKAYKNI